MKKLGNYSGGWTIFYTDISEFRKYHELIRETVRAEVRIPVLEVVWGEVQRHILIAIKMGGPW